MFGAYVRENRKVVIALAVYTAVFGFIFWLYRLPLGAVRYAALVCLFLLLVWLAVDYRRFAARLRLLRACACCGGWSRRSRSAPSSCPSRTVRSRRSIRRSCARSMPTAAHS